MDELIHACISIKRLIKGHMVCLLVRLNEYALRFDSLCLNRFRDERSVSKEFALDSRCADANLY